MNDRENSAEPQGGSPMDETGVDAKDIDLIMAQFDVSRDKAAEALRASGGDLINAMAVLSADAAPGTA